MSDVKDTAQKLVVKNKILFVSCISFIMLSLFLVCYLFFFWSITIDVAKDIKIEYSGESGSASVAVSNNAHNFNQRTQEFLNSITYQVSPNRNLSNGSTITIEAHWSEELANKYNIKVINDVKELTVEGLVERYASAKDIPSTFLDVLNTHAGTYFERNNDALVKEAFPDMNTTEKVTLERKLVYRVFLEAIDIENKDKIMDIYTLQTPNHKDNVVYYSLIYDAINNSEKLEDENIYGEKMTITNLANQDELVSALKDNYLLSYAMSVIEIK